MGHPRIGPSQPARPCKQTGGIHSLRKLLTLTAVAAVAIAGQTTAQASIKSNGKCNSTVKAIEFWRGATWKWQSQHDEKLSLTQHDENKTVSCRYGGWVARMWRERARSEKRKFILWFKTTYAKWDCIHRHEAAWNGDDNPTYDGGLQMDYSFQMTYGKEFHDRWGSADNWPVWAQILTAERAFRTRGYYPWPTRKYCGL